MMNFVHLNVKSEYNRDSLVKVEQLLQLCRQQNQQAVAIVDSAMYQMVDFYVQSKEQGIKPLFANEFCVRDEESKSIFESMLVYAKTEKGLKNLMKLSSFSKMREDRVITKRELEAHKEDLIIILDYYNLLLQRKMSEWAAWEMYFHKTLPAENLYLNLRVKEGEESTKVFEFLCEYSKKKKKRLVAATPVLYLHPSERDTEDVLLAIHRGGKVMPLQEAYHLRSPEEIAEAYRDCPEAIEHTQAIADACSVSLVLKGDEGFKKKNPLFQVPDSFKESPNMWRFFTPVEGYVRPTDPKEIRSIAFLCQLAWRGFAKSYTQQDQRAFERLKSELGVIIGKGYADYFLIVYDFIRFAKEKGIPLGPGRGSAVSSLLARCLGITEVCPLFMDLQFERFLNPMREDDPDVDLDVSQERRYELIRYAKERYGERHVSQIVSFKFFGFNDALRAAGKALGVSKATIQAVVQKAPKGEKNLPAFEGLLRSMKGSTEERELCRRMIASACAIQYIPQTDSKHAAGIILTQRDITEEIPVMLTSSKEIGGSMLITQIPNNHSQLEKLGFTKIDLLGNRNVDILEKTQEMIKRNHGVEISEIPVNDPMVYRIFEEGKLAGVFQMDSEGMQKASRLIQPNDLKEVATLLALYRPGPMEQIPTYAENKNLKNTVIQDAKGKELDGVEDLQEILIDTYGIIVFQEQINKIANVWAGYNLGEADVLRRAISDKDAKMMEQERAVFVNRAAQVGRSKETSGKIYDLIVKFSNYGFNKAHAVGYALLSYQTAWYKVNYPEEYMSVLMTSVLKDRGKASSYFMEAKRLGLQIEKPDINRSFAGFEPEKEKIQFGLAMTKNVGWLAVEEIVKERNKRPFVSLADFLSRMDSFVVNRDTVECLIKVGAFDRLEERGALLEELKGKGDRTTRRHVDVYTFSEIPGIESDLPVPPKRKRKAMPMEQKLAFEHDLLGFYLEDRFLYPYKERIQSIIKGKSLQGNHQWVFGAILTKKVIQDRNQKTMAFLTLTNGRQEVEMICFQQVWKQLERFVQPHHILLFDTKRGKDGKLIVEDFEVITNRQRLTINMDEALLTKLQMKQIAELLKRFPGKNDLVLGTGSQQKTYLSSVNVTNELLELLQSRSVEGMEITVDNVN